MTAHDVQKVRIVRASGRGTEAGQGDPEGPPGRPYRRPRDRTVARRPAAAPRSPDRAPASDPGQVSPDLGRPSRGACRRDEAVVCRSVRDRDLLRAFRRGEGGRARYRAADHPRLQFTHLRHAGRAKSCCTNCRTRPAPAFAWCARPASAAATPRRQPRSAITSSIMPRSRMCSPPPRPARPTRICPNMSTTTPMSPPAAMRC